MQNKARLYAGGTIVMTALLAYGGVHNGTTPPPATQPAAATQPMATVAYTGPHGAFQTQYPASWQPIKGDDTLDLAPVNDDSNGKRLVYIDVPFIPIHFPGMVTMKRVENGFLKDMHKEWPDIQVTSDMDEPMGDATARHIKAEAKDELVDAVLAIRKDRVYIIDCQTDRAGADAGRQALDEILGTWKWNNN